MAAIVANERTSHSPRCRPNQRVFSAFRAAPFPSGQVLDVVHLFALNAPNLCKSIVGESLSIFPLCGLLDSCFDATTKNKGSSNP